MTVAPKIAHMVLMTRQFDAMVDWYTTVFNARAVHRDPALAFLTYDDEHHRFAIANLDILKPDSDGSGNGEIGVNHVAFTYDDVGQLLDLYARLKEEGITPYWPVHHGVTLSLYYQDPDGNRLELQVDALSREETDRFMTDGSFSANPIGVRFDPEALLASYRNGADDAQLLAQPEGPMSDLPAEHGVA